MTQKKHYVTLQLGPVNMRKNDRVVVLGLITTMLNGILENVKHPKEAANFIDYFLRERLEVEDVKLLQQLEVVQRSKITIALEKIHSTGPSSTVRQINRMRGLEDV